MEKTDHVFVVGEGANQLANVFGLARRDARTAEKEKRWETLRDKLTDGKLSHLQRLGELQATYPDSFVADTVGAVAVDRHGDVAAATSTGGMFLKLPGRIGDSPLIGCGTYADNLGGACSATGIGEIAIRLVLAKSTCDRIRRGASPQKAAEQAIEDVEGRIASPTKHMGLIAVDTQGNIGAAHNSPHMVWAFMTPQMESPKAAVRVNQQA
jgi:beta-aspartyl-peptidase (threonine type)